MNTMLTPAEKQHIQQQTIHFSTRAKAKGAELVAVSKTKPMEAVLAAYEVGQRHFGENYVQELVSKQAEAPADIHWHFIGHLQSNKVKYIAPFVYLIHGVDSAKLLQEINKQAGKCGRKIHVLLQVFIAQEETKFGLSYEEAEEILQAQTSSPLEHIIIEGCMGMATNTDDLKQVAHEFRTLAAAMQNWKTLYQAPNLNLHQLSMGMTHDMQEALEAGSTWLRIGTAIFGARNYAPTA